jgi:hypothetical protein
VQTLGRAAEASFFNDGQEQSEFFYHGGNSDAICASP